MTSTLILNDKTIDLRSYEEEKVNGLYKVSVDFDVKSDDYHDIATLLYNEFFEVKIPERNLTFRGVIHNYSTSLTNLYVKDRIGQYKLTLIEVNHVDKE